MSIYEIEVDTIDGKKTKLASYKGQVMLIVNVASRCGFTKQYTKLEQIYRRFKDKGLVVLGFPCNQFAHQEPGSNQEVADFAQSCFAVSFPIFAKLDVKGPHQSALYAYLMTQLKGRSIPWNFSKILVGRDGEVIARYWPIIPMYFIEKKIKTLL